MADSSPTILIIEDDLDTRQMVARLLTLAGYSVRLASNGWEGLMLLEQPVDLVLLDMMMPGMDGTTFLESLRRQPHTRDVPVVVMTAMDRREVEQRVRPYNVSGVLIKGDTNGYSDLMSILKRTLGLPHPQRTLELPNPGSLIRPYLDLYLKVLAWS